MGFVGIVALAGIVVIALVVLAVRHHNRRSDPLSNLKPAVYQPANTGDMLPLPKR